MARKLKSDKLLFTATLLLVCTSIVMVYSASAVIAMENGQQPYLFLFKQAAWALHRPVARADRHAHRLPRLPPAGRHLDRARRSRPSPSSPCSSAARQRRDAAGCMSVRSASNRRSSRRSPSSSSPRRSSSGAWIASTTSAFAAADRRRPRRHRRPDPGRAGSRHRGVGADDRRRRWCSPPASATATSPASCSSRCPRLSRRDGAPTTACSGSWRSSIPGAIRSAAATR